MKIENIEKYFKVNPGAYYYENGKQYWQSVHGKSYTRYNKAQEQIKKTTVEIEVIINYINEFLEAINIATVENPIMKPNKIDYGLIKTQFNLDDIGDLIWLKFTKDKYVGVVAIIFVFLLVKFFPITVDTYVLQSPPPEFYSKNRIVETVLLAALFCRIFAECDFR